MTSLQQENGPWQPGKDERDDVRCFIVSDMMLAAFSENSRYLENRRFATVSVEI